MGVLSRDTDPEIEALQIAHFRQMSIQRKWELVVELTEIAREFALAGLRQRYPHDTPEQRKRRLADLLLGSDLAERAYGPGPEENQ